MPAEAFPDASGAAVAADLRAVAETCQGAVTGHEAVAAVDACVLRPARLPKNSTK